MIARKKTIPSKNIHDKILLFRCICQIYHFLPKSFPSLHTSLQSHGCNLSKYVRSFVFAREKYGEEVFTRFKIRFF